ncbi:MAG: NAD(P)-dependent alcohol dehydrogenase [Polyangiales bacterium]
MRAAITPKYGPPTILELRELPAPALGAQDVLVEVRASIVSEGDRRIRSADFPGMTAVPGRLMMGVFGPRAQVGGTMFAGTVVAMGERVTRYAVGDDVFGSAPHGAYAELLCIPEDGAMARMPAGLTHDEAAAIPYGAGTAHHFLVELAQLQPGERVLVNGATGGVGRFAVQLAKHLGAEVTAVCSRAHHELARELGADHVIDYKTTDFTTHGERYDIIFDIADSTTFGACRASLTPRGRYLTLSVSLRVLLQMGWTRVKGGQRALVSVALGDREHIEQLAALVTEGAFHPVIAKRFPLEDIVAAHQAAESGSHAGAVLVSMHAHA